MIKLTRIVFILTPTRCMDISLWNNRDFNRHWNNGFVVCIICLSYLMEILAITQQVLMAEEFFEHDHHHGD